MKHTNSKPTSARYVVILFAVTLAVVTYMQRHAISQAAPAIQADLGLTKLQMGLVFSAFLWMYALCEIPGGFAGDHWAQGIPREFRGHEPILTYRERFSRFPTWLD